MILVLTRFVNGIRPAVAGSRSCEIVAAHSNDAAYGGGPGYPRRRVAYHAALERTG
jgi:hypothetical protein